MKTFSRLRTLFLCLVGVATLCTLGACSSSPTLSISTTPAGAEVRATAMNSEAETKLLGTTPFSQPVSTVYSTLHSSGPVFVTLSKKGYSSSKVFVTDPMAANVELTVELEAGTDGMKDIKTMNGLVTGLFEARRLALVKRFDEALKKIDEIEKVNPSLSTLHELRGSIFYIQHKYGEAFDSFRQALRLDPSNTESARMMQAIQERQGEKGSKGQ